MEKSSYEKLRQRLIDCHYTRPGPIAFGTLLKEELGFDSIDEVELIMWAEDEFDIEIDDDEYCQANIQTIGDFNTLLLKKIHNQHS